MTGQPTSKFVFLLPSLLGGGAEFVTRSWVGELRRRGHEAEIALLRYSDNEPDVNFPVAALTPVGAGRIAEWRALREYLKDAGPVVVVSMMTRANFQLIIAAKTIKRSARPKVVISERNIPFADSGRSSLHNVIRRILFRSLYHQADLLISISHGVAAYFTAATKLLPRQIWVVPNPALAKASVPEATIPFAPRLGHLTLVIPSRVVEKKRPFLAMDVAELLAPTREISLLYYGEGPLREAVADEGRRRGIDVSAPGRIEDWYDHLPADAIVLLPSAVEGFANVLVEAASRGVASVAGSTALGCSDAIVPGVTGYFARGDSPAAYAQAVEAAAALDGPGPKGWLEEFDLANSTDVLERALRLGLSGVNQERQEASR